MGNLVMHYDSTQSLQNFVEEVVMEGRLVEADIASSDVQTFSPSFPDFGQFQISGSVKGKVNDLHTKDVKLNLASESLFSSRELLIRNAAKTDSIYFSGKDFLAISVPRDMRQLYDLFSSKPFPAALNKFGEVKVAGNFTGYTDEFNSDFIFESNLGRVNANLDLKISRNLAQLRYAGEIAMIDMNLGRLFDLPELGRVSTRLKVDGQGIDPVNMQTNIDGGISALHFHGYNYSGIRIDGTINNGRFRGDLAIKDPNLEFDFNGSASFVEDTSSYKFTAEITKADLHALNFAKDSIASLTATMDIDLKALNYDRWAGDIRFYNLTYENTQNFHFFQDINLHSQGWTNDRQLQVRSNILDADLSGSYTMEGIIAAVESHVSKYIKTRAVQPAPKNQNFKFNVETNNTKVITQLFFSDFEIEPGTNFKGNYSSESNEFNIDLTAEGFEYKENLLRNLSLNYEGGDQRSQLGFKLGRYVAPGGLTFDSLLSSAITTSAIL
ncbi:MAG: hypothetical protein U5L96_04900 [Owenweeksia sp.]|nr:hypothetical protein [Owenweeksia sp.]